MRETETRVELTEEELETLSSDNEGGPAAKVTGWLGWLTAAALFALSAYALYWTQFSVNTTVYRVSFLAVVLMLVFLLYPIVRGEPHRPRPATPEEWLCGLVGVACCVALAAQSGIFSRSPWAGLQLALVALCFGLAPFATRSRVLIETRALDWILVGLTLATALVLSLTIDDYKARPTRPTPEELVLGGALMLFVLEASRRTVGWVLPAIALAFLLYCSFGPWMPEPFDHRGFSLGRIIGQNALTLEGLFSTPLDVASSFIILFTIYGAVLERGGAGKFFIDWAFALFGKRPSPSAPGRAVVTSGFLLGTVSGSGVATTVTIASLAWPMLRRSGYTPNVAGGMLSAAGIGATLSPPTLGAAAFIIAEYLNVDYLDILVYATIPTLLYYLACWLTTEADARKLGVKPVKTSDASLGFVIGCVLGGFAAYVNGSRLDRLLTSIAVAGVSVPHYWLGMVMVIVFSVLLGWLPSMGAGPGEWAWNWEHVRHLVLPAITLSVIPAGLVTRTVRGVVIEILSQDFIATLRGKGLSHTRILYHVVKNAAPTALAVMGLQLGYLMGGSILVETIFAWPGTGMMLNQAIFQRDIPVLQGTTLVLAMIFVGLNLLVDLIQTSLDPRMRRT